jgi:hypothetical protein
MAAPRIDSRLLRAVARLDDPSLPMAETYRRTREVAERFGVARPSYERLRLHLKDARQKRSASRHKRDVLLDVAMYLRPVDDLYELLD